MSPFFVYVCVRVSQALSTFIKNGYQTEQGVVHIRTNVWLKLDERAAEIDYSMIIEMNRSERISNWKEIRSCVNPTRKISEIFVEKEITTWIECCFTNVNRCACSLLCFGPS